MAEKLNKDKLICELMAVTLLALLAACTFHPRTLGAERQQVQIVAFGDSLFGLCRDETGVPAQVGKALDKSVFNAALGGTCISRADSERRMDYAKDSLSLVGLSKAVAAGDFGVQRTVRIRESSTEYFSGVIDELEKVDFTGVEFVLIQHGVNDYYSGVPIVNPDDPYDEYTFTGALRSSLKALHKANPDMRIILVTPTYSWHIASGLTCEEFDAGYGVQEDYIQAEMQIAEEAGVELIDVYHDVYPHEQWEDWSVYTFDGLHPNEEGRKLLAGIILDYLQEQPY